MRSPDPYRIFFPLGIALGFAGVAVWPLLYFGVLQGYWGISHAFLQSDGFLFCFIAGFLLTAVPRFTQTDKASLSTQILLAVLIIAGAVALDLQSYAFAQTVFAAAYLLLFGLVAHRYLHRKSDPPATFVLIGCGLIIGVLGAVLNMLSAYIPLNSGWVLAGRRSLTEGMTLMLVLGVGGFLGPRLLGMRTVSFAHIDGVENQGNPISSPGLLYFLSAAVIFLSIPLEYGFELRWMSFARAIAATAVVGVTIQPWHRPILRTTLSWCVWSANWLLITGVWLVAFLPMYRIDMLHVLFLGGFTLLIFGIGLRVSLSHGGHGLGSETRNWPLRIALACGTVALVLRTFAPFAMAQYSVFLAMAAILWMTALAIWGWQLLALIIKVRQPMALLVRR